MLGGGHARRRELTAALIGATWAAHGVVDARAFRAATASALGALAAAVDDGDGGGDDDDDGDGDALPTAAALVAAGMAVALAIAQVAAFALSAASDPGIVPRWPPSAKETFSAPK